MSNSKIYNGIGPLPKGKRFGTPQEALEMKQVRHYGKLKIDPKVLEKVSQKEVLPETREKLLLKLAGLRGTIRRNKGRYETTKDLNAKDEYYRVWQEAEKELKKVVSKLKKIEDVREKEKVKNKGKDGRKNWIDYVKKVAEKEGISYKEALSVASTTYKK